MTKLLHIVGAQGSGKTQLAMAIIASLEKRGKTARVPQDEDFLTLSDVESLAQKRQCRQALYMKEGTQPDLIVLEHEARPAWLAYTLQAGDQVITIEVAA